MGNYLSNLTPQKRFAFFGLFTQIGMSVTVLLLARAWLTKCDDESKCKNEKKMAISLMIATGVLFILTLVTLLLANTSRSSSFWVTVIMGLLFGAVIGLGQYTVRPPTEDCPEYKVASLIFSSLYAGLAVVNIGSVLLFQ